MYTLGNSDFDKFYATPWLPENPHIILKEQTIFTRLSVRQTLKSSVQLIHPSIHSLIQKHARRIPTDSVISVIYCSMGTTNWYLFNFFFCGAATQRGPWPHHSWGFLITHNDASQSVGLLWTSDQLVAETSTWQHTTLTTDKHPCPRWDSNPRSQRASGRRPTP